jgi:hypothetical protein
VSEEPQPSPEERRDEETGEPDLSDESQRAEREVRGEPDEDQGPGPLDEASSTVEQEAEKLQAGPKLPFFAGPLPIRALLAMGIFVVVFMVVWLILWALLGTLGLALGWIVAAGAGLFTVKLAADRLGERGREQTPPARRGTA